MKTSLLLGTGAMVVALSTTVWAQNPTTHEHEGHDGMMGGHGMMNCPMGQSGMGLMHDPDVKMAVTETPDGITVKWTSANPEKVTALKKMGKHMESMHSSPAKEGH